MSNFTHDYDRRDYIFLTPRHIGDTRDMTTMKERLARALVENIWIEPDEPTPAWAYTQLDAILRELMEPSEGMLQAIMIQQAQPRGDRLVLTDEQRDEVEMIVADYKAMLQHILDEPQQEDDTAAKQIPHEGVVNAGEKPS